jgi:hypothetical protein
MEDWRYIVFVFSSSTNSSNPAWKTNNRSSKENFHNLTHCSWRIFVNFYSIDLFRINSLSYIKHKIPVPAPISKTELDYISMGHRAPSKHHQFLITAQRSCSNWNCLKLKQNDWLFNKRLLELPITEHLNFSKDTSQQFLQKSILTFYLLSISQ